MSSDSSKQPRDHALAIFKAGVALVPYVGGSIASLLGDYIPTATEKVAQAAVERLSQQLALLGDRINAEAVDRDEFAELFKSAYLLIRRSHSQRKINAAVALVTNVLLQPNDPSRLTYTELDHFSRSLDQLSIGAIEVLCELREMYGPEHGSDSDFLGAPRPTFHDLGKRVPKYDSDLLMGLVAELASLNLVHLPIAGMVTTSAYGNRNVLLTTLGLRFLRHIVDVADA
jgi:hypothetical protein